MLAAWGDRRVVEHRVPVDGLGIVVLRGELCKENAAEGEHVGRVLGGSWS